MIPIRFIRSGSSPEHRSQPSSPGLMRGILTLATLVSVIFFPWPLTALLALSVAPLEPLVPLAAGMFMDTLYYTPQSYVLPLYTLCGAVVTILTFFVRSRLATT